MASQTDIWNLALAHLGNLANVADPNEISAEASYCRRFYPVARDQVLEQHRWNFATKRDYPVLSSQTSLIWAYAYAMPADCVKTIAILPPEAVTDADSWAYVVETDATGNQIIYTNVEQAVLIYTYRVTDTTKFSQLFVSALSRLLAHYLAGPITKDASIIQAQYKVYITELGNAKQSDSNQRQTDSYNDFTPGEMRAHNSFLGPFDDYYRYRR